MLNEKAVKKVEKALGVKVQEGYNGKYYACYNGYVVSWRASKSYYEADGRLEASGWHVRREDDHSDSMTDYFAGSFRDNITQMINAVKPPAPKFPVGSLVRGKNNMRAKRQGYAGKIGLVMEAGKYSSINWFGEAPKAYNISYPERDLEFAS